MEIYYVSKKRSTDGGHEMHASACTRLTNAIDFEIFGSFDSCCQAVLDAQKIYDKLHGCWCCCCEDCNLG